MAKILIKNGRIWDGEKFFHGDILTQGRHIRKIDPLIDEKADFIYDAAGKIVSSGLVDIHVHLKGVSCDDFGIQAEMSSIPFGVTAVNEVAGVQGDRALLDSLAVKNTVFVAANIQDNHAYFENAEKHMARYGDKVIGIKAYFDTTSPEIRDITPLKEICDYARSRNLMVMVHCSHSPVSMMEIIETLSSGDILTHAFHGGKNACTENDFEALRLAKEKGVVIDAGMAGHVHTNFHNFKSAIAAGYLPDTISTDITCCSAYMRGGRYGLTMCMSIAKYLGMTEDAIFKAVTVAPAQILGKADQWGSLKEGGIADLAVLNYAEEGFDLTDHEGNHIQSATGYRCVLTVVDGQILYRH